MYEESGRFHQVIAELGDHLTAEEVVETIIQDVINYMADEEERDDDITLVAVRVT
jgi:serine phosphatase RsbU (regulator of sigma subunit)